MIFVTLGSQKFQFNRLLMWLDEIKVESFKDIQIFAQIGYSDYSPRNFSSDKFLSREEYLDYMENADIVVTHAGTGAIVSALKKGKRVIAVPRLARFGEHVDDHQLQIVDNFERQNLVLSANNKEELTDCIRMIDSHSFNYFESDNASYISVLTKFINGVGE